MSKYRDLEIPEECFPKESNTPIVVYRATLSERSLCIDDFLPMVIEKELRKPRKKGSNLQKLEQSTQTVRSTPECNEYGVSLFTDFDSMIKVLKKKNALKYKKTLSKGYVCNEKGKVDKVDSNGHTDYFLYDYINNNPYSDFRIIEKVKDYLK